ncbi:hypothetical protein LSAT2_012975 [Lamellibrachia satsuma]|nr:hypothetical protein LSAT2_012975 [Lamellibrachia satsuma]
MGFGNHDKELWEGRLSPPCSLWSTGMATEDPRLKKTTWLPILRTAQPSLLLWPTPEASWCTVGTVRVTIMVHCQHC